MEEQTIREIFSVSDVGDGRYSVNVNENTSVEEVAFAITVILKCFDRDEVIAKENMLALIDKYLNDVQYNEVLS
jgi:hypothetical protein